MKLSVIIPVYNVEKHIKKCLDSLLDQGLYHEDYEIIIVNDGSTDRSCKIAESYADSNEHITIIVKDNGGAGSARNYGMDCAKGDYIYFIDPDDFLLPNCLTKLVDTAEHHKLDVLTFMSKSYSGKSLKEVSLFEKTDFSNSFDTNTLSPIVTGEEYVANVKYRSEVWWYLINRKFLISSAIRFAEGRYLEDAAFSIELFLRVKRMAHLKLDTHRYRMTPGSTMNSKEPSHYLEIIRDIQYAALAFKPIIETLEKGSANPDCIARVKAKQQSLVFFSMVRMMKSTMTLAEVKLRINEMVSINAFPLDAFLGKDYKGLWYQILVELFKTERRFYLLFKLFNPVFKIKYRFGAV